MRTLHNLKIWLDKGNKILKVISVDESGYENLVQIESCYPAVSSPTITPEELYKRHVECFPNDKCVSMFGYKADQILHALNQTYSTKPKEKLQMTRQEAYKKLADLNYDTKDGINYDLNVLEALGLLKFEEEKKIQVWFETESSFGKIRVEEWPEGLVVWVGGGIRYRSWK